MFSFKALKHLDWTLLAVVLALAVIGVFFIHSASYQLRLATGVRFSHRQAVWLGLGLILYFLLAAVDYRKLIYFAYPLLGLAVIMLALIIVAGEARLGARRWLQVWGLNVQPSEIAKLFLVMALARYLSERFPERWRWSYSLVACLIALVPAALILRQPDLGTALVFVPIALGMIFLAGARLKHLIVLLLILLILLPVFWFTLRDYQRTRLLVFANPDLDPLGAGYTVIQSKIAIGSGGLHGKGWLGGTQNMLSFLPERQTDFIFSVVAEEWGFLGSAALLGLFSVLICRLFVIAHRCRDLGGRLLAAGGMILISTHVIVNVGMAMGLLPATGLPLPFISYGGTVTVAMFSVMGLCQSVYAHRYWHLY